MRFGVLADAMSYPSDRYQLLFQGEILSAQKDGEERTADKLSHSILKGLRDKIRPGQYSILAQDLDFAAAKGYMKNLIQLGVITYIEPMTAGFAGTRSYI